MKKSQSKNQKSKPSQTKSKKTSSQKAQVQQPDGDIIVNVTMKMNEASKWYAVQLSANGETINHSEAYSSKTECHDTHSRVAKQLGVPLIEEGD